MSSKARSRYWAASSRAWWLALYISRSSTVWTLPPSSVHYAASSTVVEDPSLSTVTRGWTWQPVKSSVKQWKLGILSTSGVPRISNEEFVCWFSPPSAPLFSGVWESLVQSHHWNVSVNPQDPEVLTPNHFLWGWSFTASFSAKTTPPSGRCGVGPSRSSSSFGED